LSYKRSLGVTPKSNLYSLPKLGELV